VSVSGDIFVRDHLKRYVKVGSVDFPQDDCQGNPVVAYLRRHGNSQGSLTSLANDAYTLSKDGSAVFTTPLTNESYSKVSGDFNPIHINPYYRGSEECLKSETLSLPKTSVDRSNPTHTTLSLSSRRVAPRRKSSATTNIVERVSANAEARVNDGVPVAHPSEENPVILRLKKILSIKSDQTVIEVSSMRIWYSHVISMFN
jgi:hypothetical protein